MPEGLGPFISTFVYPCLLPQPLLLPFVFVLIVPKKDFKIPEDPGLPCPIARGLGLGKIRIAK